MLARVLALIALGAVVVAVLAVVLGSGAIGGDDEPERADTNAVPAATETTGTTDRPKRRKATYRIKANDTLSGIAEANGTTVERLQELNPEIDPQGLVAGQKIKLRE